MSLKNTLQSPYSQWMEDDAPESDVVISSRARLARSLAGYPFPHRLSPEQAEQVIQAVSLAVRNAEFRTRFGDVELVRMTELSPIDRWILVEKHLISPGFLKNTGSSFEYKGLVLTPDEQLSIMVNEEDHLRIQCLFPGLQLEAAARTADEADSLLEKTLDFAFSDRIGYLTACPTNVGTGLRASVMVHLPGLVLLGQVKEVLTTVSRLGLTVRGLFGEGTDAVGNLFQVSNQVTLGHRESEITGNLASVTRQVIEQERSARQQLVRQMPVVMRDRVGRALGILKHAHTLGVEEAMRLISDVRLGVMAGLLKGPPSRVLLELMVITRPSYLVRVSGRELSPPEWDELRATLVRELVNAHSGEHPGAQDGRDTGRRPEEKKKI